MPELDKITVIDCQIAGISGDMFLGALLDLGADADKVISAIQSLENKEYGYENIKIRCGKVLRKEFSATSIDVSAKAEMKTDANELVQIVEKTSKKLNLSKKALQFTSNAIRTLVEAEAKLHKKDFTNAHLHEVSLIDTPAEIVGAAVALDDLGLFETKIYSTPVSVGGGLFKFSHGTVSSPAPATLEILQNKSFPMQGGPAEAELSTPTGAAILVNLAEEVNVFYPKMLPLKTGYGAGTKDFIEMPNVLRVTVGKATERLLLRDEVTILESNLDDVTGEVVGGTIEKLLSEGAKDVSVIPMFTKKNRPGQIVKVIAENKDVERLAQVLAEETGTLGIRVYRCERRVAIREFFSLDILINDVKEHVRVKVSKNAEGKIFQVKPEFDDAKRLADKTGKPLREIIETVTSKAREVLSKG